MNKKQKERNLTSLGYQFGKIKASNRAKKLFNKKLSDLNESEFNKLFISLRRN